jgi:hypothetical protein
MTPKQRVSATVDADLVESGHAAVAAGRTDSLSAWVNDALRAQVARERRLAALDDFLAAFEAEHGVITDAEMAAATRAVRARAVVVRGA